jgi:NAD(P)-dependent dehydrogenase (short-subunit alcohol dehydrogenase family)
MNPIAIVTGASRGIGAATARLLGTGGYDVCINYRNDKAAAAAVAADIEAAGRRALLVPGDVGRADDVRRLFETVDRELGRLSVLVNNAGVIGPKCRVDELAQDALQQVLSVNVIGLILCSQQAIRRMSTRHGGSGGCIVNVSSGAAYRYSPGGVHYSVSKGAVNSFTIGLSQEVAAEGIRVNAVSPGLTRTDMPGEEALQSGPATIPMGRVGEPSEIAEAIVWLVSDKAGYTAGANIRVAGGRP